MAIFLRSLNLICWKVRLCFIRFQEEYLVLNVFRFIYLLKWETQKAQKFSKNLLSIITGAVNNV